MYRLTRCRLGAPDFARISPAAVPMARALFRTWSLPQSMNNVAYALSTQTFETNGATGFKIFHTSQANLQVDGLHPNGGAWNDLTINLPFNSRQSQATGLAVNPFNASVVYLTLSGFTAATGIGHVFVSNDSGAHWFRADGNSGNNVPPPASAIPDVPVLRLLVDGNDRSGEHAAGWDRYRGISLHQRWTRLGAVRSQHNSRGADIRYRAESQRRDFRRNPRARRVSLIGVHRRTDTDSDYRLIGLAYANLNPGRNCDACRIDDADRDSGIQPDDDADRGGYANQ